MADVIQGERTKKILRKLLKLGYKFLGKDMQMLGEDLKYNQNPAIRNLHALILLTAAQMPHEKLKWQRDMITGYGQAVLWCVIKDTAYRDCFFWALDKLLANPEKLREQIKPYVKPPEQWIPNLWQNSRDKTNDKKAKGEIPKDSKCFEETIFTPQIQDQRHKKILKRK